LNDSSLQPSQSEAQPISSNHERWKYEDPNEGPDRKGLLLSNEIERFCDENLLISWNYSKKQLRPAAYTLRIGHDFVGSEGRHRLTDDSPSFYIEPNSIAYVSTLEELDLPYYIAARFNLRVKWVYKGILLGTGPQVEPGYRGPLSCPLYNLTDRAIKVTLREDFATIDFERTTNFCAGMKWDEVQRKIGRSHDVETLDEIRTDGTRFLTFRQRPYHALELLPDWDVVSSLVQLSNEVKTWRAIGITIVVAFFGLALTLLTFQSNLFRELRSFDAQLNEARQALVAADARIKTLEKAGSTNAPNVQPPASGGAAAKEPAAPVAKPPKTSRGK
jgi:deoxycytidine triphosphate deaminase